MAERTRRARLLLESHQPLIAGAQGQRQHAQHDLAAEFGIVRAIQLAGGARRGAGANLVASHARPRLEAHGAHGSMPAACCWWWTSATPTPCLASTTAIGWPRTGG